MELRAEELRIGNWVLMDFENVYEQVTPRMLSFMCQANSKSQGNPFKPIQLTEEILLKCGFEDNSYASFYLKLKDDWNEQFIMIGFEKPKSNIITCSRVNDFDTIKPVEYLHQLQNLYFALTGKELEIKL